MLLELKNINKVYDIGTINENALFKDFNLYINNGDFISIVGSNGSGKTSILNVICANTSVQSGSIIFGGKDITKQDDYIRYKKIGRVYQNPSTGTCADMTILENLSLADNKGKSYNLKKGTNKNRVNFYKDQLKNLNLGLEDKLNIKTGSLSGGQRQALALLMSVMSPVDLLILDEHTAALDPNTAELIMKLTDRVIKANSLTAIMVTHNLKYAIEFGNRLIMMHQGKIVLDILDEEKKVVNKDRLLQLYNNINIE